MHTTIDDIQEVSSLGPAEPIRAPSNAFHRTDNTWAVLYAAFRQPMIDGTEPHGVYLRLGDVTDPDAVLPADAVVMRSAADDEDTALLAKGLGYSVLVSTVGPSAIVSAVTREQAKAVADGVRQRAGAAEPETEAAEPDSPPPGQYL
jgi:hypothetical protein